MEAKLFVVVCNRKYIMIKHIQFKCSNAIANINANNGLANIFFFANMLNKPSKMLFLNVFNYFHNSLRSNKKIKNIVEI